MVGDRGAMVVVTACLNWCFGGCTFSRYAILVPLHVLELGLFCGKTVLGSKAKKSLQCPE